MFNRREKIPVIFNCDTGIDDAVALMIAVKSNRLDIKLIVTDLGNVEPSKSAQNTCNILDLIGSPAVPVVAGEGKCLKRERPRVAVHGNGGLGEYRFTQKNFAPVKANAVELMAETLKKSDKKVTIICLSPCTNIAKLILNHGEVIEKIERVVFMVGSNEELKKGEVPYMEFNCSTDPEAAEVLLSSGLKIDIVPMEMGHTAYLDWQDVFKTKNMNNTGRVLEQVFRSYHDYHVKNGIATHDGCTVAYVTNPELFETKPVKIQVQYFKEKDSGAIVTDYGGTANATICTKINVKKFKKLYFDTLSKCK